ncbi:MAG: lipoprotein signal peptidase [Bacteroidetes bacterium]|nr:lipoprotein signal peptidase [Bacteroidota bacterium]
MFSSRRSRTFLVGFLVVLILFLDQLLKIWVKTHLSLGESIPVLGSWFQLNFIENRGIAFGLFLGGDTAKLLLSLFRIVLAVFLGFYLHRLIKEKAPVGVLIGISLILIGAVGNVLDSAFYGLLFSESLPGQVAQFLPEGGGYAPFLQAKVVDMLYFPFIDTTLPSWVPIWGGKEFIFFRFIFNIADSAITTGILYLMIFQWHYFGKKR